MMGLTLREQQILVRSDAGASSAAIAAELGLSERYVSDCIIRLSIHDYSDWRDDVVRGSQALLDAIMHARASQVLAATRPIQ